SLARFYADMYAALDATVTRSIDGDGTGEMIGLRFVDPPREPTPMDRALDILDPELRACPLYDAGPPVLRGPYWR
ncbi:hypothetical protein ACFYRN_28795, partial [Streptomyces sp. NPDC005227]|uniref:hypothetical protein n=1 Tax=Streptomyces sp. NPDC005227 TaxID=3364707 RepID=UPI00369B7B9A